MLRFEKVATPATAATVAAPDRVPPAGLLAMEIVTFPVKPVTVFPKESRAAIWTAGAITIPATVLAGCSAKASVATAPGVMLNAVDVATRLLEVNCSG